MIKEAKKGQLTPMKYLFEMIGLYPASVESTPPEEDQGESLSKILLERLNLADFAEEEELGKGSPAAPVAVKCDSVE